MSAILLPNGNMLVPVSGAGSRYVDADGAIEISPGNPEFARCLRFARRAEDIPIERRIASGLQEYMIDRGMVAT